MESEIAFSAIRISTPLIFAALGGLLTYQAGILNIALDGFMIVAAFAGIVVAYWTDDQEDSDTASIVVYNVAPTAEDDEDETDEHVGEVEVCGDYDDNAGISTLALT